MTTTPRPQLEVVWPDDEAVEIYIDGKEVASGSYDLHGSIGMAAIEETARHVARALGADIIPADEPSPQKYRYFIAYIFTAKDCNGPGQVWHDRDTPIEDAASLQDSMDKIRQDRPDFTGIVITNFILIDGPS